MKKIKILFVGMTSDVGGIETYIFNLYKHIDKSKFEIYFLVNKNEQVYKFKELTNLGAKFIYIRNRRYNFCGYYNDLKNCYIKNNFDYIHFHTCKYSHISKYLLAFKNSKAKVIIHSHQYRTKGFDNKKTKILDRLGRILISKYDAYYVACSELAYRYMFDGFNNAINREEIIFNNGIDLTKFRYDKLSKKRIQHELSISGKTVYGHVGRFSLQKNHEFLIDIFENIYEKDNNSVLILLGEGPLEKKIKEKVVDKGLEKQVLFLGNRDNVEEYMSAMDVLIFPSLYEGLGLALIEAQACDLVIFASSDVIPATAKVSKLLNFISLKATAKEWSEIILNCKIKKQNVHKEIQYNGYDLNSSVKLVENFYLDHYEGGFDE